MRVIDVTHEEWRALVAAIDAEHRSIDPHTGDVRVYRSEDPREGPVLVFRALTPLAPGTPDPRD